jgi:hypothetical protein
MRPAVAIATIHTALLLLLLSIAWPATPTDAAPDLVFSLTDGWGDDHGDGTLRYPRSDRFAAGDLDLVSFSARREKNGTLFEAIFARPIRKPGPEAVDAGGTTLNRIARFGFYTFNLDIYVDTDRAPGSGRVAMLPGRRAEIDSSTAWERAILVTPRPYETLAELERIRFRAAKDSLERVSPRVDDESLVRLKRAIHAEIESTVYFPTRIRVVGPKIQFFVPNGFLGGPVRDQWAYVVAVSGADMSSRFTIDIAFLIESGFSDGLMILPIAPGSPTDRFGGGREDDDMEPPLVDILIAPGSRQEDVLKGYDRTTRRPARLPGIVPAETAR